MPRDSSQCPGRRGVPGASGSPSCCCRSPRSSCCAWRTASIDAGTATRRTSGSSCSMRCSLPASGLMMSEAARRRADARVLLVSLACLASAGFLALHALATPDVLLDHRSVGFVIAAPVGLILAAGFAAASSIDFDEHRGAALMRHQRSLAARPDRRARDVGGDARSSRARRSAHAIGAERASSGLVVLGIAGIALYARRRRPLRATAAAPAARACCSRSRPHGSCSPRRLLAAVGGARAGTPPGGSGTCSSRSRCSSSRGPWMPSTDGPRRRSGRSRTSTSSTRSAAWIPTMPRRSRTWSRRVRCRRGRRRGRSRGPQR